MAETEPLTPDRALARLRTDLAAAGFSSDDPSLSRFWPVFAAWAALPIEGLDPDADDDMLLYETTVERAGDESASTLTVAFTRQLMQYDEDGEYAGMEQLLADFAYDLLDTDLARAVGEDQFWGASGPRSTGWRERVEATRSFAFAIEHEAASATIDASPV